MAHMRASTARPLRRPSTGVGRWYDRVFNEVETVGVAPIPEKQRTMTPWKLFIVWAMASASATTPLIAALLFKFGLVYMVAAIVISWLIGMIPAGLFSQMGREVPLTALIVARRTYGTVGAFLLSFLFTLVNAGWFGLNTAIGAQILNALAPLSPTFWMWIVGLIQVILVLFDEVAGVLLPVYVRRLRGVLRRSGDIPLSELSPHHARAVRRPAVGRRHHDGAEFLHPRLDV